MTWGPIGWMTAAAVFVWLTVRLVLGGGVNQEAFVGAFGPLVAANTSWLAMVRARRGGPDKLMAAMMMAMAAKMVFFGVYVVVALVVLALEPVPLVVSFTIAFIGLYGMEAYFLKRYLVNQTAPSSVDLS